jgi:dihydroorotase
MSVNPRKLLGLEYISIKPNETADLVIADLNKEWTVEPQMLHSKSKNTVFKGMKLKGKPIMTLSKGEIKYKEM